MTAGYRFSGPLLADAYEWQRDPFIGGTSRLGNALLARTRDMSVGRVIVREKAIREALARWVSELEPMLVYDIQGRFIGLTHAGQSTGYPALHVPIRGGVAI